MELSTILWPYGGHQMRGRIDTGTKWLSTTSKARCRESSKEFITTVLGRGNGQEEWGAEGKQKKLKSQQYQLLFTEGSPDARCFSTPCRRYLNLCPPTNEETEELNWTQIEELKSKVTSWKVAEPEPKQSELELTLNSGYPALRNTFGKGWNGLEEKVTSPAVRGH